MYYNSKPKIVVLGGGFGGLESAFYLRHKVNSKQADITLISDNDYFLFKPNTIYIPFGLDPEKLKIKLEHPLKHRDIKFVQDKVQEIDTSSKVVRTSGNYVTYDYLVVATGAGMRPEEIPGLSEYAETIWTPNNMLSLRKSFNRLLNDAMGKKRKLVVFLVPPNNKCAGPLYEMVFMLDTWLRRHDARKSVDIIWTTYENSFIQAFGPRLHEVVLSEFERRSIFGLHNYIVERVMADDIVYKNGEIIPYDLLVSFPPYIASTPINGLPSDERGFLQTNFETRQIISHPEIYAVGDAGDFPVKQAFLAFLQADVAAESIASEVLGKKSPLVFNPVSMCVMEQLDKATFAQVPLHLTGMKDRPIEVDQRKKEMYKVGSSPVWRLGKKLLGVYLPWRFSAGNPFHAGIPWKGMELGLKAMSGILAN